MSTNQHGYVYNPLPSSFMNPVLEVTGQPLPEDSSDKSEIKNVIQGLLPTKGFKEFDESFESMYLSLNQKSKGYFHKYKRKLQKNAGDTQCLIESRKDKGSLTSKERREMGLHKVNRFNKTFKSFLPINEKWKQYAQKYLSLSKQLENGWKGEEKSSTTVNIQNLVRKIEYFGCFVRITKSRCSNMIGVVGIVIKETRDTFILVCPDNKVKTIPKMHNEFSFVVDNVGFSIYGNHLNQKSSVRAKHTLKKHCLWL